MVQNALKLKICVETRVRKRKTNYKEDKLIICEAKKIHLSPATPLKKT